MTASGGRGGVTDRATGDAGDVGTGASSHLRRVRPVAASTFPRMLADQVRRSAGRPVVTFYDDATGERVELSAATYANWVAKTAGLLQDELDVERGGRLLVDLPTHWLGPVWIGAAWSVGAAVTDDLEAVGDVDVVVCGPAGLDRYAGSGALGSPHVVALSLLPLGARFSTPLPEGVLDYGASVWGQPDLFVAADEPAAEDLAWFSDAARDTQGTLLDAAVRGPWSGPGTRLLTDANPCSAPGLGCLLGPLTSGGGTVWVSRPESTRWDARAATEQVTSSWRAP